MQILLHYHYSPEDYPCKSEAFNLAMNKFVKAGIFECAGGVYIPNKQALAVYVKALSEVPLPKSKWVIENSPFSIY